MPGVPNKYQPMGRNEEPDTIAIKTGILLSETTTPTKHNKTINTPGGVTNSTDRSAEYGFWNHMISHRTRDNTQNDELINDIHIFAEFVSIDTAA